MSYCGHEYKALGTSRDDGWACDGRHRHGGCKSGITGFMQTLGMNRFRCDTCSRDLCDKCFAARKLTRRERKREWAIHRTAAEAAAAAKTMEVNEADGADASDIRIMWSLGLTARSLGLRPSPAQIKNPSPSLRRISDLYEISEEIGRGSFGVVFTARHLMSGTRVALKTVPKAKVGERYFKKNSVHNWRFLRYTSESEQPQENLIRMLDILIARDWMYVVMEELRGEELYDCLKRKAPITELFCRDIMRQILLALQHIHSRGIVHRDVKVEALRYRDPTPSSPLVLFDFGHCCYASGDGADEECVGTLPYMAPEAFGRVYSAAVDVWSAGVILYIMMCGRMPFLYDKKDKTTPPERPTKESLQAAMSHKIFSNPLLAVELLHRMLVIDPQTRCTTTEALNHAWFNLSVDLVSMPLLLETTAEDNSRLSLASSSRLRTGDFLRYNVGFSTEALREEHYHRPLRSREFSKETPFGGPQFGEDHFHRMGSKEVAFGGPQFGEDHHHRMGSKEAPFGGPQLGEDYFHRPSRSQSGSKESTFGSAHFPEEHYHRPMGSRDVPFGSPHFGFASREAPFSSSQFNFGTEVLQEEFLGKRSREVPVSSAMPLELSRGRLLHSQEEFGRRPRSSFNDDFAGRSQFQRAAESSGRAGFTGTPAHAPNAGSVEELHTRDAVPRDQAQTVEPHMIMAIPLAQLEAVKALLAMPD